MHKIFAFVVAISLLIPAFSFARNGEKTVGLLAGYTTQNNSGLAGLFFQYRCNSFLRLSPDCSIVLKHKDRSAFQFNGNAHFIINTSSKTNIYPLVGITYQNWKIYDPVWETTYGKFGANFGAGFEMMATSTLKLSFEGKYSLVKDFSSANFFVSIGYLF